MKIIKILCILPLCLWLMIGFAQQKEELTISGTVVNENGEPVANVSIYLKDKTNIGTSSDEKWQFSIKADYGDKIAFTFVGYEPVEYLVVESQIDLQIELNELSSEIDEVVVVGLGAQQRKIGSVGAITTVYVKELQSPAPSISNLLGGRAAGVISMQASGEPGQNIADFWVRSEEHTSELQSRFDLV